jgi:hypothetical protein
MFSSRLPFCIDKRMSATPLESALEVISIRPKQSWPGLCISTRQKSEVSVIHVHLLHDILTFQAYKRWMSPKAGQIMLIEYAFHLVVDIRSRTTRPILHLHPDLASELIILCEYRYHRDFENAPCQCQSIKCDFDVPFLSWHISSKCLKSSDGRLLSSGMQYLRSNLVNF